jgi:diguanylate cyclase (GGDEF)-like protein
MPANRYHFTTPRFALIRWLTYPGHGVSRDISSLLLGELYASPNAVIAGLLNGLIVNIVALCLHSGLIFAFYAALDGVIMVVRLTVVHRAIAAASQGRPTSTDYYLMSATSWCALQGAVAFTAMRTGIMPLQLLSTITVMGLVGPICARNYAAPRYAMMLICLCDLPFVAGAALSGDPWLLVILLQTPIFLFGVKTIISRIQTMAIATLQAEQAGRHRSRHDSLTGLLNRFGLMEALDAKYAVHERFILFYLDLDGFKPINDTFGHHAGDEILAAVAARLCDGVRAGDIVSRLGGDEFVVVAPNMSPAEGASLADSLIRRITDEPYRLDGIGPLRIGVSIGFACTPEDAVHGADLHRKADAALYEAKSAGRGTHRRYRPSPASSARQPTPQTN